MGDNVGHLEEGQRLPCRCVKCSDNRSQLPVEGGQCAGGYEPIRMLLGRQNEDLTGYHLTALPHADADEMAVIYTHYVETGYAAYRE